MYDDSELVDTDGYVYTHWHDGQWRKKTMIGGFPVRETTFGGFPKQSTRMHGASLPIIAHSEDGTPLYERSYT